MRRAGDPAGALGSDVHSRPLDVVCSCLHVREECSMLRDVESHLHPRHGLEAEQTER